MTTEASPVHRASDGELMGFVAHGGDEWVATTVFGADLRSCANREQVARYLLEHGLAVMAQRWWLWSPASGRWRPATLVEAGVGWVHVRLGLDPKSQDVVMLRGDDVRLLRRGPAQPEPPSGDHDVVCAVGRDHDVGRPTTP